MTHDEKMFLIEETVKHANGQVAVYAGTGTANTQESIELTRFAERVGADGVLVVCPYYIRPDQEGIYQHFRSGAGSTSLPVIAYNIPIRTGRNMEIETIIRLSEIDNIMAIKDTAGNLLHTMDLIDARRRVMKNKDFSILSGEDGMVFPSLCVGGDGAIAASGHIVGSEIKYVMARLADGDISGARSVHYRIKRIVELLFAAPNPAPLKAALDLTETGLGGPVRLPLVKAGDALVDELRKELINIGRIKP